MKQTKPQDTHIPTLSDIIKTVDVRFQESVAEGHEDSELIDQVSRIFTASPGEVNMLDMLLCARGCHEASNILQERGDSRSGFYHAMAQDLIAKAIDAVGITYASIITEAGLRRH